MNKWYRTAIVCAVLPLVAGVIVFLAWLLTRFDSLLLAGFAVLVAGCALCLFGLFALVMAAREFKWKEGHYRREFLLALGLLLINFPIAFSAAAYTQYVLSPHSILVINNSDETIGKITFTDAKFYDYSMSNIPPHSQVTKKFHFRGEGSVKFEIMSDGIQSSGVVLGSIGKGTEDSGSLMISPEGTVEVGREGEAGAD